MNRRVLFRRLATIAAGAAAACALPVSEAAAAPEMPSLFPGERWALDTMTHEAPVVADLTIRSPSHRMLAWTQGTSDVWEYALDITAIERTYVDGVRNGRIAPGAYFEPWKSAWAFADKVDANRLGVPAMAYGAVNEDALVRMSEIAYHAEMGDAWCTQHPDPVTGAGHWHSMSDLLADARAEGYWQGRPARLEEGG